jgi:hypothetical protein
MSVNSIDSDQYVDGSIDSAHLAADVVTGAKIADDAIDSEHYTDGSIDTDHLADNAITAAKLPDNVITATMIPDDLIDSNHYAAGSIDNEHLADDAVGADELATNAVVAASIVAGSITTTEIAANTIAVGNIADNAVDATKIASNSILTRHIDDNQITGDQISDDIVLSGTGAIRMPDGTTGQRPGSPAAGMFRYNTTDSKFEGYTSSWGEIGGGGTNTFTTDTYTNANSTDGGSNLTYTLSQSISDEDNLIIFIDGVFQNQAAYSVSGTTLTLADALQDSRTMVVYSVNAAVSGSNLNIDTMTGDNSDTTLALSVTPVSENNTQVFIDGVYQAKSTYSTSGSTLTFSTAPPTGAVVECMPFTQTVVNVVGSSGIADNAITSAKIATGVVIAADIANDSIDSQHYVAASIDNEHLADDAVDSDEIAAGAIDLAHMSVNSIDSDQYVDGSIDSAHLAADVVTGAKIADDAIDSEHIADGSIDLAHMSVNSIDSDQYVDGSIDAAHLAPAQTNITSVGTLTTLTVDNVIINGSTIGHTGDTDLITVASGIATVAGEVSMTTLDIGGTNITATAAELNYVDGVTSAIQTQMDTKASTGKAIAMAVVFG